jgi:hypothetical protein
MDQVDRFICEDNISRFVDQLRREINPARQETLKDLLIEEENRFGARGRASRYGRAQSCGQFISYRQTGATDRRNERQRRRCYPR